MGEELAEADTKNRDIAAPKLFHGLVEGVFGERVHATGEYKDGLLAANILEAVEGFKDSVEDVGFAEAGGIEMIDALAGFILVLCEVLYDAGPHVKSFEGYPVLLLKLGEKGVGPISGVVGKKAVEAAAAEFEQHDCSDGSFRGGEVSDGLGNAIIENAEVFFLKTRDDVAMLGGSNNIKRDDGNVDGDGYAGLRRRVLRDSRRFFRIKFLVLLRGRRSAALGTAGRLGKRSNLCHPQHQAGRQCRKPKYGRNGLHDVLLGCNRQMLNSC